MASKQELKRLKKRKAREQEKREVLLKNRQSACEKEREERQEFRKEKQVNKFRNQVETMKYQYEMMKSQLPQETREQIEKNIEVLSALEQEYIKEKGERDVRNQTLENEGALTLEEKLERLKNAEVQVSNQKSGNVGIAGSAVCKLEVNKKNS